GSDDEVGELCRGFNVMLAEIERRERQIIDLAHHDAETDLPNRIAFESDLKRLLKSKQGRCLAVAAVGVDRFQYVRGVIGYHLANDVLGELGARALSVGAVTVARLSSDVVGFLIDAQNSEGVRIAAAEFLAVAEAPMDLGANAIEVTVSIGLAIF